MKIFLSLLAAILLFFMGITPKTQRHLPQNISAPPIAVASPSAVIVPVTTPSIVTEPTRKPSPTQQPVNPYATSNSLFSAMNTYRKSRGLSTLSTSNELCLIAQARANDQQRAGHLDHSNFQTQAATQKTFHHVGEILQYWDTPQTAEYLVNTGWASSGEHAAIMNDPSLTHGCGGIAGFYSVFIFGR
jgi:uncharacterized protein YkwD